jgi:hypothetical protein
MFSLSSAGKLSNKITFFRISVITSWKEIKTVALSLQGYM